jgi:alanine racemase
MYLLNLLRSWRRLFANPADHLLRLEISRAAFEYNVRQFRRLFPKHRLAAVLKSNAYGHGLIEIGRLCDALQNISLLVVDSIIEARLLRDSGVKKPLLILGHVPFAITASLKRLRATTLTVNSLAQARFLARTIRFPLTIHIKTDTGMHRQGVLVHELEETLNVLKTNPALSIGGLLSHLADADNPTNPEPTHRQLSLWDNAVVTFLRHVPEGELHYSATAGTEYIQKRKSTLIRAGIGLYGFDTSVRKHLAVKPVLSLWAKIVNVKTISREDRIGYNFTFTAPQQMTIAVIPCGYYEALPRTLSNKGYVYGNDVPLEIVGTVSMNLTTVDVSSLSQPPVLEDEIEVLSNNPQRLNSVENVARLANTIPYEILVHIAPAIKRVVV